MLLREISTKPPEIRVRGKVTASAGRCSSNTSGELHEDGFLGLQALPGAAIERKKFELRFPTLAVIGAAYAIDEFARR